MLMSELVRGLGLPDRQATLDVRAVTADSRAAGPGTLFVAIQGARADGRAFIADAVARGASAVLAPPGTAWPPGVPPRPMIEDSRPRLRLAQFAYRLAGPPPERVVAVTGTNGKTSIVEFTRQLWTLAGRRAASLGTLGVIGGAATAPAMTTPDPVALAGTLAELARGGVTDAALEASSHGLAQYRLDGLKLVAGAFTNLTRDHLDYHGTVEDYRAAKLRLFADLLPEHSAAIASTTLDSASRAALTEICRARQLALRWVGDDDVRLVSATPTADGQVLVVQVDGATHEIQTALPGRFQADNMLVAAALAQATGVTEPWPLLSRLVGVRGRMELAARTNGAAAYVDYAHTPDALERLLTALRPHATRLIVVFGAGGDRDRGKRPLMGEACARLADFAIVTDDNPRSENAAAIRAEVLAGCPDATEVAGRRAAIAAGLELLRPGDVLVVAGKGHEQGQEIGGVSHPFDDASVIRELVST